MYFGVDARNTGPIWSDVVTIVVIICYNFWSKSPMNMKFWLEMSNLMVIKSLIFQKMKKKNSKSTCEFQLFVTIDVLGFIFDNYL